jgi:hypothetical protein
MSVKQTATLIRNLDNDQRSALFATQNLFASGNHEAIADVVNPMFLLAAWDSIHFDHFARLDFSRAVVYAIRQFVDLGVVYQSNMGCGYDLTALGKSPEWS